MKENEVIDGGSMGRSKVKGEKGKDHYQMRSQKNECMDEGT